MAPVLPAVHGHEQMPPTIDSPAHAFVRAAPLLGVDGRVAGDPDVPGRDPFADQRRARPRSGSEMKARQAADHLPKPLFWKRPLEVVGTQPGFDVRDGDVVIEGGQRALKGAFRIALDDDRRPRRAT